MIGATVFLSMLTATTAGAQPNPAPARPAPPFVPVLRALPGTEPAEPMIVRFRAGPPACAGAAERPVLTEEPFPTASGWRRRDGEKTDGGEVIVRFRIAADGRPLGISEERSAGMLSVTSSDIVPAVATWRFAPGAERQGCEIRFRVEATPVSQTPPETLYRFLALHPVSGQPLERTAGAAAFRQITPAGSNCLGDRPNVRLQAYPHFETIPQADGTFSYSFMSYDLDRDGRPRDIRLVGSGGNAELDRQSLTAVGNSRFQPGARTGCLQYFYRREGRPTLPPLPPVEETFRPESATCPKQLPAWDYMPPLVFPQAFNRRGLEGWAVVRYDLLPSGETRNVEVAAAEPAAVFGEHASRIVRSARRPAAEQGFTGCTDRVIFRIPRTPQELKDGG